MKAIEKFDQIIKEAEDARQILAGLIKQLEDFTTDEVDEVNARKDNDFEALMNDIVSAEVSLEDCTKRDYDYATFEKEFRKELEDYKVRKHYEWDADGFWTNHDDFDEIYFGFEEEVYVVLKRDGKIYIEAFGEKKTFNKGEYNKVKKYLNKVYLENGYDGKYNI